MNYSRAFSYVFEDKNWLSKILIAGLISLIPIIGQIYLFGWMVEIVRRTKAGRTDILPTTHFTYFLTLGLKVFVVCLIYSIPVIILSCILGLMNTSVENSDSSMITVIFTGVGCLGSILTFVVHVAVSLLGTYGIIKLAETDQIKACLDFNDAFYTIKDNIGTFIIVELLALVAGLIQSAGFILCFVGAILTVPYGVAIVGNLVGQLWDNLKVNPDSRKPRRGTVSEPAAEDIIEEAPFTMVDDIEKQVADVSEEPKNEEIVIDDAEQVIEETEQSESEKAEVEAEAEVETVPETEETVEETAEEAPEETPDSQEEEKSDTDIPSFE